MAVFHLPYGEGKIEFTLEDQRIAGILVSQIHDLKPGRDEKEMVRYALEHPIGAPRLRELAKGKKRIAIISSDHTRPVPSRIIMPQLLKEIRTGNPAAEITIVIATGCHRATKKQEIHKKYGSEIAERETFLVHDCMTDDLVHLGVLPSGGPLLVNSIVERCDLLVAEGFIEPHLSAGFSGGRKSVLPGIASYKSVMSFHSGPILSSPYARTGILKHNPVHEDSLWAAKAAKLAFICNVVLNENKEIVCAVAGGFEEAHAAGCDFLQKHCIVDAAPAEIVVATNGGYPLDQDLYQAVKGMTAAEATVKPGGVIIMLAQSRCGHGSQAFYHMFLEENNPARLLEAILATPPEQTKMDQWEAQILARILARTPVIYVSRLPDKMVMDFGMIPAPSLEEAMGKAEKLLQNPMAKVTVIPNGIAVIVKPTGSYSP